MTLRNVFIFLATFATGAVIALVVRSAVYQPHAQHEGHPAAGGEYAPMVTNPLAPANPGAAQPTTPATPTAPASAPVPAAHDPHANHAMEHAQPTASTANPAAVQTVNTVCTICGMPVDPSVPTLEYQGKVIGFGCKLCAPKFKADPDRYGPVYLKNEVIKR